MKIIYKLINEQKNNKSLPPGDYNVKMNQILPYVDGEKGLCVLYKIDKENKNGNKNSNI